MTTTTHIDLPTLEEAIRLASASALTSVNVPEVEIGIRPSGWSRSSAGDPWTATIGSTNVSYRSDQRRRLELALEQLIAAATIPQLLEAHDKHLEELEIQYLKSDDALDVLTYAKRQVERERPLSDGEAWAATWFHWINAREAGSSVTEARECHDKWRAIRDQEAENERINEFEDGRYVAKRQQEIPAELGWASYDKLTEPLRAAVDHLIEKEISK